MPKKIATQLTEIAIKNAKAPAGGRIDLWDAEVSGLTLRVSGSGHKSWALWYRDAAGVKGRTVLGAYPAVGLSEARKVARIKKAEVEAGANIKEQRRQEVAEEAIKLMTVADLFEEFITKRTNPGTKKPLRHNTARQYRSSFKKWIFPRLGARTIGSLKERDLVVLLDGIMADLAKDIAEGKVKSYSGAIHAYATMSAMFAWAKSQKILDTNLMVDIECPTDVLEARKRYLCVEEMVAVWNAALMEDMRQQAFFTLGLLTGMRFNEIRTLTWDRVNLEEGWVFIPKEIAKNKQEYHVLLSQPAIAVMQELWDVFGEEEGDEDGVRYVLASKWGTPMQPCTMRDSLLRVRERSGVSDFTFHDLRKTLGSQMGNLGYSADDVGRLLNHSKEGTVTGRSYMHGPAFDYRRQLTEFWGGWVMSKVNMTDEVAIEQ